MIPQPDRSLTQLPCLLCRESRPQPVKLKYEVFVCTASQRPYALEVWRLLDPGGLIIEPCKLHARLVNVPPPNSKTLSLACTLGAAVSEERSVFPLAIIADDRLDVGSLISSHYPCMPRPSSCMSVDEL